MTVSAVGQNDNSRLYTVAKATTIGAAAGYASKYLLPVTKQEDTISLRSMINYCRKITNKAKIEELNKLKERTPAQDEFIKMAESKDKKAFGFKFISDEVKSLSQKNAASGKEFLGLVREVNTVSKSLTRRFVKAYHVMLKDIRPAAPFVVAGAGVGFLAGFAHNVMKTDFDA